MTEDDVRAAIADLGAEVPSTGSAKHAAAISAISAAASVVGSKGISGIAPGGMVSSVSAATTSTKVPPPFGWAPPVKTEHVLLPQKAPKKVLVAFLDDDGNPEPYWAAYLEPQRLSVNVDLEAPEDGYMEIQLSLVRKFEQ